MSDDARRSRAKAMFEEVNGFPAPDPPDFFQETTLDHIFGDVWTRPGLTRKERRLITLTTIAMTGAATAMEVHVRSALESGDLSREEMGEFAAHFAHYAGFPIATQLYTTFQRIAAELDAAEVS
ncbi:MAG: carboxymuconolactone decarboxylase family protein [bacterium]|nr:carboxymuconolactone decarboxylase family protein [bacterium]